MTMRVWGLAADHWVIGRPCSRCGEPFAPGDLITDLPVPSAEGSPTTAQLVHLGCAEAR